MFAQNHIGGPLLFDVFGERVTHFVCQNRMRVSVRVGCCMHDSGTTMKRIQKVIENRKSIPCVKLPHMRPNSPPAGTVTILLKHLINISITIFDHAWFAHNYPQRDSLANGASGLVHAWTWVDHRSKFFSIMSLYCKPTAWGRL